MTSIGYFTSLSSALNKIARYKMVSENKTYTIKQYIKEYEQLIEKLINTVKI
jgi:hypothetical protein